MASIKVFWGSGSPYARRVLFYLEEKGLKYESIQLSFSDKDLKTPEFLKMNPKGQVPTVLYNDIPLYESMAILDFIEKKNPEPKMLSDKDEELARQLITIQDFISNFKNPRNIFFSKLEPSEWNQKELFDTVDELVKSMKHIDEQCKDGYVAGSSFSLADVVIYPSLAFLERLGYDFSQHEHLEKYLNLVAKRKAAIDTYPPHWKDSENKTILRDFISKAEKLRK
jgi:glutathione S-transferase